jgi:heat-inducible transcriptional repressor
VRLLAQITGQVAVVQYPSLTRSSVRHLELVSITPSRLMLVMITDTGRVEQRIIELSETMTDADVSALRTVINDKLSGCRLADTPPLVASLVDEVDPTLQRSMTALGAVLLETLIERADERLALAGTANLTRAGVLDFHGSIRPVLEALEEEVVLLKLIGVAEREPIRIRIGDENEIEHLRATSVVSTGYGPGATVVGGMGVLGPTRMDYPATIAAVSAVARYVGELLGQN